MPDFITYHTIDPKTSFMTQSRNLVEDMKASGAIFFRITQFDETSPPSFCLEGWKIHPSDQGPPPKLEDFIGFGKQDNIEG